MVKRTVKKKIREKRNEKKEPHIAQILIIFWGIGFILGRAIALVSIHNP